VREVRLGLRENLPQFSLLVLLNAFVGAMVGLERTVLPLLGEQEFGLSSKTAITSFIVSFGVTKAVINLVAARLSDRIGRKPILVAGWVLALPVPFLIIFAPAWWWIDLANVLLGANQAMAWSMTVIMKVDLVGPKVKAVYPICWGLLQVATGPLSDRHGRKGLITWGMIIQAVGIWLTVLVPVYGAWIVAAALQGLGTAMVYPTLLAAITDHAHPTWRASSLGVYRFWRDLGYAVGALLSGLVADLVGLEAAIHLVAALTLASGLGVARLMETSAPVPRPA
jgi:MFS family permease